MQRWHAAGCSINIATRQNSMLRGPERKLERKLIGMGIRAAGRAGIRKATRNRLAAGSEYSSTTASRLSL